MPNAGLPVLGPDGASYPLSGEELAQALDGFVSDYGVISDRWMLWHNTRTSEGCC
jgi:hypothetical protein